MPSLMLSDSAAWLLGVRGGCGAAAHQRSLSSVQGSRAVIGGWPILFCTPTMLRKTRRGKINVNGSWLNVGDVR